MGDAGRARVAAAAAARVAIEAAGGRVGELKGWSARQRATFFDHLAMTGDVDGAAAAVGLTARDAYAALRSNANFAKSWRRALDIGYDRLEAAAIRRALGQADVAIDVAAVLLLLDRRRSAAVTPAVVTAKKPVRAPGDARARAERDLLRQLQRHAARGGTPEPA